MIDGVLGGLALEKVRQLRRQLDSIRATNGMTLASSRLKRWEERAMYVLRETVSRKESEKLEELIPLQAMATKPALDWLVGRYDMFLRVLEEDIAAEPGRFFPRGEGQLAGTPVSAPDPTALPRSQKVFIVHGHDEPNMFRLRDLLLGRHKLEPVILSTQAGKGRTLIEKFEMEAESCSFAFVLMTSDDTVLTATGDYAQARPNVVFELGWFYGRLGRARVVMLLRAGTKIHSDLEGIVRIQFERSVEEKVLEIEQELRAAKLIT